MKTTSRESRIAVIVTVFFILSTGFAIYYFSKGIDLKANLQDEKIKSEKMLSEKLSLSKEIEKLNKEIDAYKGKNSQLDKSLAELQSRLQKKEAELNQLVRANNPNYKKQLEDLQKLKAELDRRLMDLNKEFMAMQSENQNLRDALGTMEEQNNNLVYQNQTLNQFIANNFETEAHKKRAKLTVNAKRAKEIVVGFDIPSNMTEKLKFTITSPDGSKVASNNSKSITYAINNDNDFVFSDAEVVASTKGLFTKSDNTKKVALTYTPETKLKGGVYQIDIYADDLYVGSCRMKLK